MQRLKEKVKQHCRDLDAVEHERQNLMVIKVISEEVVYLDFLGDEDRTKQTLRLNELLVR